MSKNYMHKTDDFISYHMRTESPVDYPLHNHNIYEIIFLKNGDLSYMSEGKIYKPVKNSLILTPPLKNHSIHFHSDAAYERYCILFDEKSLPPSIQAKMPSDTIVVNFDSHSLMTDLFKKMDYYYEMFAKEERELLLKRLMEEALFNITLTSQKTTESDVYTSHPLILSAIEYIEKHLHSPFTINDICDELYISKSHLHHLFIRHLQMTPQKYIMSKKLSTAQRELRFGRKATEIFSECGFADYSTFFRAYKSHFGHAPSAEIDMDITREILS